MLDKLEKKEKLIMNLSLLALRSFELCAQIFLLSAAFFSLNLMSCFLATGTELCKF